MVAQNAGHIVIATDHPEPVLFVLIDRIISSQVPICGEWIRDGGFVKGVVNHRGAQ